MYLALAALRRQADLAEDRDLALNDFKSLDHAGAVDLLSGHHLLTGMTASSLVVEDEVL